MENKILRITTENSNINFRKPTNGIELKLVKEFIEYKTETFINKNSKYNLAILEEPEIDNSYPDVIFAEYDKGSIEHWNNYRNVLSKQDLKILYHLYATKGLNAKEIVKQLGIGYSDLIYSLEKLMDANMLKRDTGVWQVKNENDFFAIRNIETVEAKANQWNSAFKQALQNTRFSSESYVLTQTKGTPSSKTIDMFNEFGIGMYLKKESEFKKLNKARKNSIPNSYTSLLIGEIIGKAVNF